MADLTALVKWFVGRWRPRTRDVDPDELWQEVWVAVLEAEAGYDPGRGKRIDYAAKFVRRRVMKLIRDRVRAKRQREAGEELPGRDEHLPRVMPWGWVRRVVGSRSAGVLRAVAGGSTRRAIAGRLGITRQAVQLIERRAVAKLREAAMKKPDPRGGDKIEFRGELVALVDWVPCRGGERPDVMPMNPDCVPAGERLGLARELVRKAAARLVELTPGEARRLIFGDG